LPLIFDTQVDAVPATIPYVAPDQDLVARWRERLGGNPGHRISVGLVWQGNPGHLNDQRRSIRLDLLRPLLDCPGTRFVSLQIGRGREQLADFDERILDTAAQIDVASFADAAAIIGNLDLVISIDTARRQASERAHELRDELRILMVHGVLHLLGYDHEDGDVEHREMAEAERTLLTRLGWTGRGLIDASADAEQA
jgi:rRNA maturation RNase YbeY